jgi:hypothetical protein
MYLTAFVLEYVGELCTGSRSKPAQVLELVLTTRRSTQAIFILNTVAIERASALLTFIKRRAWNAP